MSENVKIYVVSLRRSVERRELMEKQLAKAGVPYEFVDAFDANLIGDEEHDAINSRRIYGNPLKKGEIACARSHGYACKRASEESYDHCLVIEDDVILGRKLKPLLAELSRSHDSQSITLLCSLIFCKVALTRRQGLTGRFALYQPSPPDHVFGTQAYFLTPKKAAEFSSVLLQTKTIADDWKHYLENGVFANLSFLFPFPMQHAEFLSAVNARSSGGWTLRSAAKSYIYKNKLFPFYDIFLWQRRRVAEKRQRSNIEVNGGPVRKTYDLA